MSVHYMISRLHEHTPATPAVSAASTVSAVSAAPAAPAPSEPEPAPWTTARVWRALKARLSADPASAARWHEVAQRGEYRKLPASLLASTRR
jgi:hypothetical protein